MVNVSNCMTEKFWVPFMISDVALFLFYLKPSKIKLVKYELFPFLLILNTNGTQNDTQLYFDHTVQNQGFSKTCLCQPSTYDKYSQIYFSSKINKFLNFTL